MIGILDTMYGDRLSIGDLYQPSNLHYILMAKQPDL